MIRVRAPTRIDFGGGWTDVPPYCDREGGYVCNVAITRYATATVTTAHDAPPSPDPLVAAVQARLGLADAAIALASDFPVGAGLGGSSAACSAAYAATLAHQGKRWDASEIAEAARDIEIGDLRVPGGQQDYYAATHGGALGLTFSDTVGVERLPVSPALRADFERRALLIYTGESRVSGDTITAVLDAYRERERRVLDALATMKDLARGMARALVAGDLDALGGLVGDHWRHQRSLHPAITTARIDEIIARARRAGAVGAKALGASGGGTVLVIGGPDALEPLRDAVLPLGAEVPFALDLEGLCRC